MQIETERLILRSMTMSDLADFSELLSDPAVMHFLGGPVDQAQSERQLREIIQIEAETGLIRFGIEQQSTPGLIGYCGLKPAGKFVDLSYAIAKRCWGNGYASEAAQCARDYGLAQLKLNNMEAGGAAENVASIKILAQLGFRHREELIFNDRPAMRFYD